jgi:hypothetical protein
MASKQVTATTQFKVRALFSNAVGDGFECCFYGPEGRAQAWAYARKQAGNRNVKAVEVLVDGVRAWRADVGRRHWLQLVAAVAA